MNRLSPVAILPLYLVVSCSGSGDSLVPERSFGEPATRYGQPFTRISGVRELSDGRIVVSDEGERLVLLLDSVGGNPQPLGRQGQGPTEYSYPAGLLAFPGDSTLVFDLLQNRFLLLDPAGTPVRVIGLPQTVGFGLEPRGDGRGNIYLRANPLPAPDQMQRGMPDSAPILRWNVATGVIDTVASLRLPRLEGGGTGDGGFVFMMQPMPAADDWSVERGGWVGIARVSPYAAEWIGPEGRTIRGTAMAYTPVPVVEEDKVEWQQEMQQGGPAISIPLGDGGGDAPPPPDEPPPGMPELKWPSHKPPFLERSVIASPDRRLWILRTRRAGDQDVRYDVIDSSGTLVERVKLKPRSRIAGFGAASVYVSRTDDDGLQWLERYRI